MAAGKQLTVGGSVDLNVSPLVVAGSGNTVINGVIGDVLNDPVLGSVWTGQVGTLTMAGSGTLILGAANTYSGKTLISSGTLQLAHPLALQNTTLDTSGSGCLSFGGETAATLGGLLGPGSLSLTNTANAAVTLTVGANNASTAYSGGLSGAGASLVKTGSGTLVLSGNNTYSGGTTVDGGDLSFAAASALPAAGAITVGSGGYVGVAFSVTAANFLAQINETGTVGVLGFEATPSGAIDLTDFNDSVRLGTRTFGNARQQQHDHAARQHLSPRWWRRHPDGQLRFDGFQQRQPQRGDRRQRRAARRHRRSGRRQHLHREPDRPRATLSVATINAAGTAGPLGAGSGAIVLGDSSGDTGTLAYTGATTTTSRLFSLAVGGSGDFNVSSNGALSIASSITGGGSLAKTNAGLLVLSSPANGYLGSTNFNGGEIGVSTLGSLGANPVLNFNGGGIRFEAVFDPSLAPMTFNGPAILDTGALGGSQGITLSDPVGNGGAGSLVKTGAGLLTLAASNTYSGGTTVSGGTLAIDGDWALGAAGGGIVINGGTLRLAASGINTARGVGLTSSGGTIDTDGFNSTFSGTIFNTGGGVYLTGLTKIGAGMLTLSGNNTFDSGANVLAGTLSLMSTAAVGTNPFLLPR